MRRFLGSGCSMSGNRIDIAGREKMTQIADLQDSSCLEGLPVLELKTRKT
jgi:hypothetical protein